MDIKALAGGENAEAGIRYRILHMSFDLHSGLKSGDTASGKILLQKNLKFRLLPQLPSAMIMIMMMLNVMIRSLKL